MGRSKNKRSKRIQRDQRRKNSMHQTVINQEDENDTPTLEANTVYDIKVLVELLEPSTLHLKREMFEIKANGDRIYQTINLEILQKNPKILQQKVLLMVASVYNPAGVLVARQRNNFDIYRLGIGLKANMSRLRMTRRAVRDTMFYAWRTGLADNYTNQLGLIKQFKNKLMDAEVCALHRLVDRAIIKVEIGSPYRYVDLYLMVHLRSHTITAVNDDHEFTAFKEVLSGKLPEKV